MFKGVFYLLFNTALFLYLKIVLNYFFIFINNSLSTVSTTVKNINTNLSTFGTKPINVYVDGIFNVSVANSLFYTGIAYTVPKGYYYSLTGVAQWSNSKPVSVELTYALNVTYTSGDSIAGNFSAVSSISGYASTDITFYLYSSYSSTSSPNCGYIKGYIFK